jgi:cytochrome c oxidase assembly protein subunit 15
VNSSLVREFEFREFVIPSALKTVNTQPHNPALHRLALLTAAATFPLIFMGGLVTSKQAGMSVPDWPNSYGYNMFLFPPRMWVGGIFYEHTHRLMGTVVGMLSIWLAILAWKRDSRRWVGRLAVGLLSAVIVQGTLGGLRVVLLKLNLAIVHACLAQAVFCLAALVAVVTSRWWIEAPNLSDSAGGRKFIRIGVLAVAVIYAQLIVGAVMRHYEAGLAVTDMPLIYGKILPPTNAKELAEINQQRMRGGEQLGSIETFRIDQATSRVTLAQIWIHVAHRVGALAVTLALLPLIVMVLRRHRLAGLTTPAIVLIVLLLAQLTLGVLTVLLHKPADIASAHVAVGALTLMTTFVLTARACRLYSPKYRSEPSGFQVQPRQPEPSGMNKRWATN